MSRSANRTVDVNAVGLYIQPLNNFVQKYGDMFKFHSQPFIRSPARPSPR